VTYVVPSGQLWLSRLPLLRTWDLARSWLGQVQAQVWWCLCGTRLGHRGWDCSFACGLRSSSCSWIKMYYK
jgi:hypothetical protein